MSDSRTVFVVDDDRAARQSLGALLKVEGYEVRAFETGDDFLADLAPDSRGCVLLDVKMPGLSGLEVQQVMKERQIGLPVVMITGHGDIPMAVKAMKGGAVDFVEKPYRADRLLHSVKQALQLDASRRACAADNVQLDDIDLRLGSLTPREAEVMAGVVRGLMNKQIAAELGISDRTVEIHRARVMEKMKARSLADLVRMCLLADQDNPF